MNSIETGNIAENQVCEFLKKNKYSILKRNFRTRVGEIDIIGLDNETVFAVEVKKIPSYWNLEDIQKKITRKKMLNIKKTLSIYLSEAEELRYKNIRFDVAAVVDDKIYYWKEAF